MFKNPNHYDSHAFPPSLSFASAFLASLVIGVLVFETIAAALAA